ncbi:hypothetical protein SAMN04488561_2558 [Jiangella alba]|uniref:NADPH-dependent FMN reductase n=1 Tax=Jiangella alba TaxID=561176 RepID=A0A1H5LEC3_9ACTN|nr:hypothetical protein SAMN04488561_2558 [Jiangella alba]
MCQGLVGQVQTQPLIRSLQDGGVNRNPTRQVSCGQDDVEWPRVHDAILAAEILVVASPTCVGRPATNLVAVARALAESPLPAPS